MKLGDRVRHKRTGQTGTIARLDDCGWGGKWIIAADESFRGKSGMLADGFAANEADLELLPEAVTGDVTPQGR
jgi:hypothetical protein